VGGSGITGRPVLFTAAIVSAASPPFRYELIFGDGSSATVGSDTKFVEIEHVYARAGVYATRLAVTDASARSGENSVEARINDAPAPPTPPDPPPPPGPSYRVRVVASPAEVVAGQATVLTATADPLDGAPPTANAYDWDCLNDGSLDATGVGNTFTCMYPTSGTRTAAVVARNGGVSGSGSVSITVLADAPLFVAIAADDLTPVISQIVTFTATVTSAGNIPATLRWYWDFSDDGTYDVIESGPSPNTEARAYGAAGITKIKVRVVDEVTAREATSTLAFTVGP
jgi:hypothetical protein